MQQKAGWRDLFVGQWGLMTAVLASGVALHGIGIFVAATVMPSVVADLGGLGLYSWSFTLFIASSIVSAASGSALRQVIGAQGSYLVAGVLIIAGLMIAALAPSFPILLIGRALQGLGGGFILANSYAIVGAIYPEALRPRGQALLSGMWGVAALVGPALGGVLAGAGHWRAAFWVLVPGVLLVMLFARLGLPAQSQRQRMPVPGKRLALLGGSILVVSAASSTPALWQGMGLLIVAVAMAARAVWLDGRASHRLFSHSPLAWRRYGPGYWIVMLLPLTTTPMAVFVPLAMQRLHGLAPVSAGYFFTIFSFAWTLSAVVIAGVPAPAARHLIRLGPVLVALGLVGTIVTLSHAAPVWIALVLALTGLGIGLCWSHVINAIVRLVPPTERAMAASSVPTFQTYGMAFGAALGGLVANASGLARDAGPEIIGLAIDRVFIVFLILALIGVAAGWRLVAEGQRHG